MAQEIKSMITPASCAQLFSRPTTLSAAERSLLAEIPSFELFDRMHPVEAQEWMLENAAEVLTEKSPTLHMLDVVYGEENARAWVFGHLANVAVMTGVATGVDQMTTQLTWMARNIIANYPTLRASELMIFFSRFKAGYYERFYGTFDPMVITASLNQFVGWAREVRWREMERIKREEERRKREEALKATDSEEERLTIEEMMKRREERMNSISKKM